ncbi:recombinase family protein [Roseovarius arcticus]|uniref:recombinase family protein n=1 Tax=Roseovarius arcticus TaxID=2547404 RepID=UPI001FE4A199|nr:recombinase family protein [Roseovarius arcticus]
MRDSIAAIAETGRIRLTRPRKQHLRAAAIPDWRFGIFGFHRTIGRFTEVESGGKDARLELTKALHLGKLTGATLVIAKLDRLSRNAVFL